MYEALAVKQDHQGPVERDGADDRRAPQQLLLAFLGAQVLGYDHREYLSAGVFIDVLGYLGVSETSTRGMLNRMARKGFLDRVQAGRVASFGLTPQAEELLRQGRERVVSKDPFTPSSDGWTLLSYSIPEVQRDVRHQLRSKLQWAGFGRLRDGLWIAPGVVDIREVVGQTEGATFAFAGRPLDGTSPNEFVRGAWDLDLIESEHRRFLHNWTDLFGQSNPVAAYTALQADWLRLLRADPGLPAYCLPDNWPADQSLAVHARAANALSAASDDLLDRMIASRANRR